MDGGAREERSQLIVPEPAEALAGLLDISMPPAGYGDPLPPLWHWAYLLEHRRQSDLGPDGHPTHGVPEPPGAGRTRMFAGGRVTVLFPLRFGERAVQTTWLAKSVGKQGRSGQLTFATTRTEIRQQGSVALVEEQDIVYRVQGSVLVGPARHEAQGGSGEASRQETLLGLDVDPVVLFRFSALTYNAHRIHYDLPYVLSEGYPDLVVHGPLQALLMAEAFRRSGTPMRGKEFSYRLIAPTFGSQRMSVVRGIDDSAMTALVRDAQGLITATSAIRDVSPQK